MAGQCLEIAHDAGIPTWAPDWSRYARQPYEVLSEKVSYRAGGSSEPKLRFITDGKLAVIGALIDEIVGMFLPDMEDLASDDWSTQTALFDIENDAKKLVQSLREYLTGGPILEAYCKILTLNRSEVTTNQLLESYASFMSFRNLSNYRKDTLWGIIKPMARTTVAGKSSFEPVEQDPWREGAFAAQEAAAPFQPLFFSAVQESGFVSLEEGIWEWLLAQPKEI